RTSIAIGVPSVTPSNTPERISAWSASLRCVVSALWPGRRRSSSRCTSAASTRIPGGMPSTTTPTAGPGDSPKVVTTKSWPMDDDTLPPATRRARGARALRGHRDTLRRRGARALPVGRRALGEHRGVHLLAVLMVRGHHALELNQVAGPDVGARARDPGLAPFPRHDVLAGVIEEQLGVQDLAVHHRAHHLPVGRGHAEPAVRIPELEIARLDLAPLLRLELGQEPLPSAAQL